MAVGRLSGWLDGHKGGYDGVMLKANVHADLFLGRESFIRVGQ